MLGGRQETFCAGISTHNIERGAGGRLCCKCMLFCYFVQSVLSLIVDIFKVNSLYVARFMFCYKNLMLPPILLNLFITNNQVHNYNTRIAENYRPQACRTNLKQFTILFQGPKIWNALPSHIKDLSSLSTFKKHMIEFLLRQFLYVVHIR